MPCRTRRSASAYVIFGFGSALVSPPIANTAVSGMPSSEAGVASAVATTSRQVGLTLGVAIFGVMSSGGVNGKSSLGFAKALGEGVGPRGSERRADDLDPLRPQDFEGRMTFSAPTCVLKGK